MFSRRSYFEVVTILISLVGLGVVGCSKSSGGSSTINVPVFQLSQIQIYAGTPSPPPPMVAAHESEIGMQATNTPTQTPTKTPTPSKTPEPSKTPTATFTPRAQATTTSINVGDNTAFGAQAFFVQKNNAKKDFWSDISLGGGTIWTTSNSVVLNPPLPNAGGVFQGASPGCACVQVTSGGAMSGGIAVAVATSAAMCAACPTPPPTIAAAPTKAISEVMNDVAQNRGVLQWTFDAGAKPVGNLAATWGGGASFITDDGMLHSLDSQGHELFHAAVSGNGVASVDGGLTIAMSGAKTLASFDTFGAPVWRVEIGKSDGPIAATGSTIFAQSGDELIAVSSGGIVRWRVTVGKIASAIATPDGLAIAGKNGSIAMVADDGAVAWSFTPAGGFAGTLSASDDAVLAHSISGKVYALDTRDGHERWSADLGASASAGPVAVANVVVLSANGLIGIAPDDAASWTNPYRSVSSIVGVGDSQAFVTDASALSGMMDAGGNFGWESRGFGTVAATATSGSTLFVLNSDGVIFAVK